MEHSSPNCLPKALAAHSAKRMHRIKPGRVKHGRRPFSYRGKEAAVRKLPMRLTAEFISNFKLLLKQSNTINVKLWLVSRKCLKKDSRCYTYKHLRPASRNVS